MQKTHFRPEESVLIVEDDPSARIVLRDHLREEFFLMEIDVASNMEEACRLLNERKYDILIVDLHLGVLAPEGGFEILKAARQKGNPFRSIALTVYSEYGFRAGQAGFHSFLKKPFSREEFINTVTSQAQLLRDELRQRRIGRIFAVMPFDQKLRDIYLYGIKAVAESAGYECYRIDDKVFTNDILTEIYRAIDKADIVIADLTGNNGNVYYEVGYAHAKGKPVILLSQAAEGTLFDLRNMNTIIYHGSIDELRSRIEHVLSHLAAKIGSRNSEKEIL